MMTPPSRIRQLHVETRPSRALFGAPYIARDRADDDNHRFWAKLCERLGQTSLTRLGNSLSFRCAQTIHGTSAKIYEITTKRTKRLQEIIVGNHTARADKRLAHGPIEA